MSGPTPNFFLVGAKKCGTSAITYALNQHPEIYFPQKEIHFFVFEGTAAPQPHIVTDWASYCDLFQPGKDIQIRGDASPTYLFSPGVAEQIRERVGDVKVAAALRHPAERVFSDYLHERQAGRELAPTLQEALKIDESEQQFGYLRKSFYADDVETYREAFSAENVHIALYDDFVADPRVFIRTIFRFLNVDSEFEPSIVRLGATGLPRSTAWDAWLRRGRLLRRVARRALPQDVYTRLWYRLHNANLKRPDLDAATRSRLIEQFADDIGRLEAILDRDLTAWRQ